MNYKKGLSATELLIWINVGFFIFVLIVSGFFREFISFIALEPASVWQGQKVWTLLTSMFMHGNFLHLFVNMFSLFFLGSFLESLIGKRDYITIYFAGGLLGGVFFVLAPLFGLGDWLIPAVGASGAIFALGGALAVITPRLPVYIMFIPIPIPMYIAIFLMFIVLSFIPNIANSGHFGGLVAGLIIGAYFKKDAMNKLRILYRHGFMR